MIRSILPLVMGIGHRERMLNMAAKTCGRRPFGIIASRVLHAHHQDLMRRLHPEANGVLVTPHALKGLQLENWNVKLVIVDYLGQMGDSQVYMFRRLHMMRQPVYIRLAGNDIPRLLSVLANVMILKPL